MLSILGFVGAPVGGSRVKKPVYTFLYIYIYIYIWGGAKNRRILLAIQFLNFLIFFLVILAVCFPKLAFGTSKIEILRSKSVWGQIFMQIRPKFNDFLAIYEFVMIFSRMARCLVFVDPIFCPPPYVYIYIYIYTWNIWRKYIYTI